MLDEFREHLKSQNKSQNIIDSYIQLVQDYFTWLSSKGKEPTNLRGQNIDESISYAIFEETNNIML